MLADRGVTVYATVRSQEDADRLSDIEGVVPFLCDVTDDTQVRRLREDIEARGLGLYGLVHNAGIAVLGHLTTTPLDDMRQVFEVNVFGVHRVTNAFADLIVASQGRIVTISSLSGTISSELMGVYSMTKHALEAYTDALAAQLAHQGVHVCAVVPGNFASAIVENAVERFSPPPGADEGVVALWDADADRSRSEFPPPEPVAEACIGALLDPIPLSRYLVVPNAEEADMTLDTAAREWAALNVSSPHRWSHERLLEAVDAFEGPPEETSSSEG